MSVRGTATSSPIYCARNMVSRVDQGMPTGTSPAAAVGTDSRGAAAVGADNGWEHARRFYHKGDQPIYGLTNEGVTKITAADTFVVKLGDQCEYSQWDCDLNLHVWTHVRMPNTSVIPISCAFGKVIHAFPLDADKYKHTAFTKEVWVTSVMEKDKHCINFGGMCLTLHNNNIRLRRIARQAADQCAAFAERLESGNGDLSNSWNEHLADTDPECNQLRITLECLLKLIE